MWQYRYTDELYHYGVKGMKWGKHKVKTNKIPGVYNAHNVTASDYADAQNMHPFMVPISNVNGKPRPRKITKGHGVPITARRFGGTWEVFKFNKNNNKYYTHFAVNQKMRNQQVYGAYKVADAGKGIAKKFLNRPVKRTKRKSAVDKMFSRYNKLHI